MATRSNICLVINKDDLGKTMKFDKSKLPQGVEGEFDYIDKVGAVTLDAPVIEIYHHWDGYPEGVGETLLTQYNTYETALNLLLGGDASTINGDKVIQYCAWRDEEWESVKPQLLNEPAFDEEYLYKFENGKWWFKAYEKEKWNDLATYIEQCDSEE